jgi:gamma-glutamyl:cysteine ligase YbdK (ATP-grasp superfamily)
MKHLKDRVCLSIEMILDKAEKIGREKKEWTIDEVYKASDIVKDMAEALKDLSKMHHYLSEHADERY